MLALLIEGDLILRDTLREIMGEGGFDVVATAGDQEALAWLASSTVVPQVIVAGFMKYEDDVSILIDRLDRRPAWREIPVVLFPGHLPSAPKARPGGPLRHLRYPIDYEQLLRLLKELAGSNFVRSFK